MSARKRLDRLNALYARVEDRARSRLGGAQTAADRIAGERERIGALGREYRDRLAADRRGPASAGDLKRLRAFIDTLDSGVTICDVELRRRLRARDEALAGFLAARRRVETIDRLARRIDDDARVVERRAEQKLTDEAVLRRRE